MNFFDTPKLGKNPGSVICEKLYTLNLTPREAIGVFIRKFPSIVALIRIMPKYERKYLIKEILLTPLMILKDSFFNDYKPSESENEHDNNDN